MATKTQNKQARTEAGKTMPPKAPRAKAAKNKPAAPSAGQKGDSK